MVFWVMSDPVRPEDIYDNFVWKKRDLTYERKKYSDL